MDASYPQMEESYSIGIIDLFVSTWWIEQLKLG